MKKSKSIYETVFDVYELNGEDSAQKRTMRRLIKRHLQIEFNQCGKRQSCDRCKDKKGCPLKADWSKLSELERKCFIYIYVKDHIMNCYVNESRKERIKRKIEMELRKNFLAQSNEILKYNDAISKVWEDYYNDSDSDSEKHTAYEQFCNDFKEINNEVKLPTYEEWVKQNKIHPLRIFDYMQTIREEVSEEVSVELKPAPESDINKVILDTIIKIFKTVFDVEIDVARIVECLTFLHNYEIGDEFNELLIEYNLSIPMSKEKQEQIIDANKKYFYYKEMYERLDFYQKVKK